MTRFARWLRSAGGAIRIGIIITGGVAVTTVGVVTTVVAAGGGGGTVTCNSSVNTRAALLSALTTTGSSGQTICVTATITGASISTSTDMTSQARFIAQPDNMTVGMVPLNLTGAAKITIEGFEFANLTSADAIALNTGASTDNLHIIHNYFHDIAGGSAVDINSDSTFGHSNFQFIGNHTLRISCSATGATGDCGSGAGYGVYCCGGGNGVTSGRIAYNTFEGGGATGSIVKSADNAELGNIHSLELDHNILHDIRGIETTDPACPSPGDPCNPHADTILIWATSGPLNIHDNRATDGTDFGLAGDSTSVTFANNLVVKQTDQACIDSNYTKQPAGWAVSNSTVWACTGANWSFNSGATAGGNSASNNLISDLVGCNAAAWSDTNHGNFLGGAKTCWPGATNTASFTPTFSDTSNPDSTSYYIPTNTSAGYTYVPAGYTNCGC